MVKADILNIEGKKVKQVSLPGFFSTKIRQDIMLKCFYIMQNRQPYSPNLLAGKKYSASGKIRHARRKWKTSYGRGISRVPRKVMWRRGTQFYWIGATIPSTRGGRRTHPPKVIAMISTRKINKKEYVIALKSVISSTASEDYVKKRYSGLENKKISGFPIIVESEISRLKTKQFLDSLKKILKSKGENLYEIAVPKKTIRAGKGKMRGRKYKKTPGLLLVVSDKEKPAFKNIETITAMQLSVTELFPPGRLTIYTENAIQDLEKRFEKQDKEIKEESAK